MTPRATDGLPPVLLKKIDQARHLSEQLIFSPLCEPATIPEYLPLNAAAQPDKEFLIYYNDDGRRRAYTYQEMHRQVCAVASHYSSLGLKPGDRIATAMHNHDQTVLATFAAWHLGLSVVPLNMSEDDKRLNYVIQHAGVKLIVVMSEYLERIETLPDAYGLKHIVADIVDLWSFTAEKITTPSAKPESEALVVYTSGTTGSPKGVALTQYNLVADAFSITEWHGFTQDSRMMCVLPIHHVNGMVVTHATPMFFGGSVVLNRKFQTSTFFARVSIENVNVVSVVPTLLQFLVEGADKDFTRENVPTLSHIICGAGPLTVDMAARFEDRFKIPIVHGYGLSESTCYSCFVPVPPNTDEGWNEHKKWMREHGFPSIGVPITANEMEIHDELGMPLPSGEKGEIVIRGHNIMTGYANNPAANENAFTYGWFRSGDEGFWMLGPGLQPYFFISGRFKELIIRGGVKISPLEVDEVLNRIPGVKAGLAVGFESALFGEEVGAYVVKKEGANPTEDEILAFCKKDLASHAAPKVVVFGESFPVTSTGKYQRNQLKPLFAAWKDKQFK